MARFDGSARVEEDIYIYFSFVFNTSCTQCDIFCVHFCSLTHQLSPVSCGIVEVLSGDDGTACPSIDSKIFEHFCILVSLPLSSYLFIEIISSG